MINIMTIAGGKEMNNKTSFEIATIELEPKQRFFRQTESDCSLVLVDKIEINHYAQQIILSGTHFEVDYEDKAIERTRYRTNIHMETDVMSEYSDEEVSTI